MSGFDETTQGYDQQEENAEDQWLGGTSDGIDQGADPEPSEHVENEEDGQEHRFEVHGRQDQVPQWKGNVQEPKVEDFETIEEYQRAQDAYDRLPPVPWMDDPHQHQRSELENHINNYSAAADLEEKKGNHRQAGHLRDMALSFAKDLQNLPASLNSNSWRPPAVASLSWQWIF